MIHSKKTIKSSQPLGILLMTKLKNSEFKQLCESLLNKFNECYNTYCSNVRYRMAKKIKYYTVSINYIQQYQRCLQHNKWWSTAHSLTWHAVPYGLSIPYIPYILHLHILHTTIQNYFFFFYLTTKLFYYNV